MTAAHVPGGRPPAVTGPTMGRIMVGIGVAGIVVALLVMVIGVGVSRGIDDGAVQSLELTADALETLDETIDIADALVTGTVDSLETLESAMRGISASFTETRTLADGLAVLAADELPATIEAISETLPALEATASSIDRVLGALGPLAPGYDPAVPLAESIGELRTGLEPLPESLRRSAADLEAASASLDGLDTDLATLADDIATLRAELARTEAVLAEYGTTTAEARVLATDARDDIGRSAAFTTAAVVLTGLLLAVSQVVPIWLGLRLRAGADLVTATGADHGGGTGGGDATARAAEPSRPYPSPPDSWQPDDGFPPTPPIRDEP